MAVVWKVKGNGINPNGAGEYYAVDKRGAKIRLTEWRSEEGRKRTDGEGPLKVDIRGREDLAAALNNAAGAIVEDEE